MPSKKGDGKDKDGESESSSFDPKKYADSTRAVATLVDSMGSAAEDNPGMAGLFGKLRKFLINPHQ